jgi:BRCT domain type II-containing protein
MSCCYWFLGRNARSPLVLHLRYILKESNKPFSFFQYRHFYDHYEETGSSDIPDLKAIIPDVKSKVLAGASLVFSGLVPTHQRLETSRAYQVARSLGAQVTQDFTENTTHLVAVRPGKI